MYVLVIQNIQYLQPDFWKLTHSNDLAEPWKRKSHTTSTFHHRVSYVTLESFHVLQKKQQVFCKLQPGAGW